MTDLDAAENSGTTTSQFDRRRIYEVFNPDFSVGVACNRDGVIVGIHLGDEVWDNADQWLSNEVLRVARLAYLKSKIGKRAEFVDRLGNRQLADALNLPTEAHYEAAFRAEFGSCY